GRGVKGSGRAGGGGAGWRQGAREGAKEILKNPKRGGEGGKRADTEKSGAQVDEPVQMALFGSLERKLTEELRKLDVSRLSPIEALNLLHKWSEEAKR